MRSSCVKLIASSFFCSLTLALSANGLPVDLNDLEQRWQSVEKNAETKNLMSLDQMEIEDNDNQSINILSAEIDQNKISDEDQVLESIVFRQYKDGVQEAVMKTLFSRSSKNVAFCEGYENLDIPELDLKEGEDELTEEEKAKRRHKLYINSCKRQTAEMMSGILFADPQVYLVEKNYSNSRVKKIVLYVKSLLAGSSFLRYSFTV